MDASKKHAVIQDLKRVYQDLGRAPKVREYYNLKLGKFSERQIATIFGTFNAALSAAGIIPVNSRVVDGTIFNRNIESQIQEYIQSQRDGVTKEIVKKISTIATISDIHWPFSCQRVIDKFYKFISINKPDYIILNGDAWDMFSHGRFPRSHNVFTPREEQLLSRKMNEEFWVEIKKASPKSKCIQMLGNHDIRPMKKILSTYPEAEDWVAEKLKDLFTYKNVRTIFNPREELIIGDVAIFHGYRSGLGEHRDYTLLNCVNGHTHLGGVSFRKIRDKVLWELNSGFAGDPNSKGLSYTTQKITKWTPGFGFIDQYGPRFIPA